MGPIKVTIHSTGTGPCALTGKEGPGLMVTFDDGTIAHSFLSWRAFQQLLGMKAGQAKQAPTITGVPLGNGPAPVK